jgi:predicted DNA-binding protein (MmcQ/YjbR family)
MAAASPVRKADQALLEFALRLPGAYEDHPWGERVAKVKGKVFVFLGVPDQGLSLSVKLPSSGTMALGLPFATPTAYGLGKSGWVTARFGPKDKPPVAVLKQWIDESYRAVAPKRLLRSPASSAPTTAAKTRPRGPARTHASGSKRKARTA